MNLVLRSTEKMFYMQSPFDSEDLLEVIADSSLSLSIYMFLLLISSIEHDILFIGLNILNCISIYI